MTIQENNIQKDICILELMILKIARYFDGILDVSDLIYDLEGYLNQLTTVDKEWKRDFRTIWMDIEVIYSLALDQGLECLTVDGAIEVEILLCDLKGMAESKMNELSYNWMLAYKKTSYNCRVCGFNQGFEPWGEDGRAPTFDTCKCCVVQFGLEDCNISDVKQLRKRWLRNITTGDSFKSLLLEEQMRGIPEEYK